jgi:hypothetical protein
MNTVQLKCVQWHQNGLVRHFVGRWGPQLQLLVTEVYGLVSNIVHAALDEQFTGRWIGRGGPINWPARSLNLTPHALLLLEVHQRHGAQRKGRVCSQLQPKDYSGYRCGTCGCALLGVGWSGVSFRRLLGRQWCSHWIALNGNKTWRDCKKDLLIRKFYVKAVNKCLELRSSFSDILYWGRRC